jgi:hypothetical protein
VDTNICSVEHEYTWEEKEMREALRYGSSKGIALQGMTFGQKALSTGLACAISLFLIVLSILF